MLGGRQTRVQQGRRIKVCLTIACDFDLTTFLRGRRSKQGVDRFFLRQERKEKKKKEREMGKKDNGGCIDCWLSHFLVSRTPMTVNSHAKWSNGVSFQMGKLFFAVVVICLKVKASIQGPVRKQKRKKNERGDCAIRQSMTYLAHTSRVGDIDVVRRRKNKK